MAVAVGAPVARGAPRSAQDAAFVARFDSSMRVPLIVSAILPLIVAPQEGAWFSVVVGIVSWLVFLVDYVVHRRRLFEFNKTGFGRFDLVVVIVTAPWFLLPGAQGGGFVVLLRVARLARLLMASRGSRQLLERLGRVAGVAIGVTITGSLVAYVAEHPTNPGFATVGDAFWWGVVTLTTVGYGDIVPKTSTGRWAAVVIMFTGVAVLGVLAGSLASFLRLQPEGADDEGSRPEAASPSSSAAPPEASTASAATSSATSSTSPSTGGDAGVGAPAETGALGSVATELAALRQQVALLSDQVAALAGRGPRPTGASPGDPAAPSQAQPER